MKSRQLPPPSRKISETFLDFVSPVIDLVGSTCSDADREAMLKVGFAVWNAVVFEDALGQTRFIDSVRRQLPTGSGGRQLVDALIAHKRAVFANDFRLIGDYKIKKRNGHLSLWAEARDPFALPQ
jgi:hypothetical protein